MSLFGLGGLGAALLGGLGDGFGQRQSQMDAARLQAFLQQQANLCGPFAGGYVRRPTAQTRQPDDSDGNIVDAEFTVLDEQPALEHTKLLEDKR